MKANYKGKYIAKADLKKEVEKQVRKEYDGIIDKVYEEVKQDIVAQLMATCCCTLHASFGFGKARLKKFKAEVEDYFSLMLNKGIFGKPFTPLNCIEYMRDEFGIDFDARVEIRNKEDVQ